LICNYKNIKYINIIFCIQRINENIKKRNNETNCYSDEEIYRRIIINGNTALLTSIFYASIEAEAANAPSLIT